MCVDLRQHGRRQIAHTQSHILQWSAHIPHLAEAGDVHDGRVVRLRSAHQLAHLRHRGTARLDHKREQAHAAAPQGSGHLGRDRVSHARRTPPQRPVQVPVGRQRRLPQVL